MGDISVPALTSRGKSDCGIAGIPQVSSSIRVLTMNINQVFFPVIFRIPQKPKNPEIFVLAT